MNEFEILEQIKIAYKEILKDKLVGIYIHGSIAFKCFNWDKSDIDFLVVVNENLKQQEKEALISTLLDVDKYCPEKGLEMSVVLDKVCKPFVYPTPYELHFSNSYCEEYKNDLAGLCERLNGTDKDLAAHITVINQVGITLCGKEKNEVFEPVPKEFYVDSILYDIENANEEIEENPVYFILNLCRVLAYLESGQVLSKRQGGQWGIDNLPEDYETLIKKAIVSYKTDIDFQEANLINDFANYMLMQIKDKSNHNYFED